MISPISFRASTTNPAFNDLIRKPQSYTTPTSVPAATEITEPKKKSHKGLKIILGVAAAIIAGGAALAWGQKSGKLASLASKTSNEFLQKVIGYGEKAGEYINKQLVNIKNLFSSKVEEEVAVKTPKRKVTPKREAYLEQIKKSRPKTPRSESQSILTRHEKALKLRERRPKAPLTEGQPKLTRHEILSKIKESKVGKAVEQGIEQVTENITPQQV